MARLLTSLADWWSLPTRDGFAALDMQIDKLRMLRDSYQISSQDMRNDMIADVN
jgi:hypothetical protein